MMRTYDAEATTTAPATTAAAGTIILDHVSFRYSRPDEDDPHGIDLSDITLSVRAGETVLLCGESGCGKTTLTRLANGLIPHYHNGFLTGAVTVDGIDVAHAPIGALSGHVKSVFHNPQNQFFATRVDDELAFPCENMGMPPDVIRRRLDSTLRSFALGSISTRDVDGLSGGQQQQVACASASMPDPPILVLDEPTSNLDSAAIARLRRIMTGWRDQGRTILIAEHRLTWLEGIVDRAVVITHGRIEHEMSGSELSRLGPERRLHLGLRTTAASQTASETTCPTTSSTPRPTTSSDNHGLRVAASSRDDKTVKTAADRAQQSREAPTGEREQRLWTMSGIRRRYRHSDHDALDIPVLRIPDSRITVVLGPNGSGKTTFLRWVQGLDRRARGRMTTPDGIAVPRRERLRRCFTVMQDVTQELVTPTVMDDVLLSLRHQEPDARRVTTRNAAPPHAVVDGNTAQDERIAMGILARLDLSELARRHPLSLSGGQRQRVAVAAGIASGRTIIPFDEPSSGLDLRHMHQIADQMRLLTSLGTTVIVVTHDEDLAALVADHIVKLDRGRVTSSES